MSGSLTDALKKLIQDQVAGTLSDQANRIGTVNQVNDDGTAFCLIDGRGVQATVIYPVVVGQQVIVMPDNSGGFKAAPTQPTPKTVPFDKPPFFAGGFIRFLGGGFIQDAFSSNAYQILAPDLPGYVAIGQALSPDGTRGCIVWMDASAGGFQANPAVHYRVYDLGSALTGKKTDTPLLLTSTAKMRFEVVRNLYNFFPGPPSPPYSVGTNDPQPGSSLDLTCALDDNKDRLYWLETEVLLSSFTGATNGESFTLINLFQFDNSVSVMTQLATWTTWFVAVGTFPSTPASIVTLNRAVFDGAFSGSFSGDFSIRGTPGIIDPTASEIVGVLTDTPGEGSLTSNIPFLADHIPNNFVKVIFAKPNGAFDFSSLTATGPIPADEADFPAGSTSNGPLTTLSGAEEYNRIDLLVSGNPTFGSSGQLSRQEKFSTYIYNGVNTDEPRSTTLDFVSVMYKDSKGNYVNGRFTNSISGDPNPTLHSGPSILPFRGTSFMMGSKTNGWFIDRAQRVRLVTSIDGVNFSMDSDITKFLQVSPGQDDPTITRVQPLAAVSTL